MQQPPSDVMLVTNGVVVTAGHEPAPHEPAPHKPVVIEDGAVAWQGTRITAVGSRQEMLATHTGAELLDAGGGLILPGLVNLHHHFYSALARGLDPGAPLHSFGEVLEGLWWRLDRALDADAVRLSALLSLADCIRWGCTTVFDHHASPGSLAGSLDLIAAAVEEAGVRAVLCYEVSDRNGRDEAAAGIAENLDFTARYRQHPRLRGMLGLHAAFTVGETTMAEAAAGRGADDGCHLHVAEDPIDVRLSLERHGDRPVQRLERHGLLDRRAILAHGVHLSADDLALVAGSGAVLVHAPESNANNGVGRLDVLRAAACGCLVGLGTDGMSSAMLRALRAAFLALRAGTGDPSQGFEVLPQLLDNNAVVAGRFFAEPLLGTLTTGAPADITVIDVPPPTPMGPDNLFGHLVYGAAEAPVRHTIAGGRLLLRDFRHTTLDPAMLARQAREVSPVLWRRFHQLGG